MQAACLGMPCRALARAEIPPAIFSNVWQLLARCRIKTQHTIGLEREFDEASIGAVPGISASQLRSGILPILTERTQPQVYPPGLQTGTTTGQLPL